MRWRACESLIAGLESASCSSSSFSPLCGPMRRVAPLWSEIDWAGRKWTVPAERMKERIEHEVPLSSAALAVLRETRHHPDLEDVRQRSGESDLVFPTLTGRRLYNNGLANFVKQLQLACVPHGFRSSFSTWSAEAGHDFALAEICLSHAVGTHVSRIYRRTGVFVPRIPIMEEWGCYVAPVRSVAPADSDPTLTAGPGAHSFVTPRVSHVAENARGRDFVVGDVHGCFRTLERALAELDFDPGRDRLFGVGDLVNRGPHSVAALEWLERRFEAVALGNHNRAVLRWFETPFGTLPPSGSEWLADVPEGHRFAGARSVSARPRCQSSKCRRKLMPSSTSSPIECSLTRTRSSAQARAARGSPHRASRGSRG